IKNKKVRSKTVLPLYGSPEDIKSTKKAALQEGLLLGNGYGELKESTLRIANFPALKNKEVKLLRSFLESHIG
ncbi:MAG: alanine--glyoxylate aminotransferase family protein, partial [Fulvivirga sp.]|nr:alanine--glyoxylate aminotransferase family protein [Fulvivirga sp.]